MSALVGPLLEAEAEAELDEVEGHQQWPRESDDCHQYGLQGARLRSDRASTVSTAHRSSGMIPEPGPRELARLYFWRDYLVLTAGSKFAGPERTSTEAI